MKRIILIAIVSLLGVNLSAQHFEEHFSFSAVGDQIIPLGFYPIGSAIRIECQISGGWAEDGGIYHIVSDWGSLPKVIYRGESSISNRLRFFGYLSSNTKSKAYLFIKWKNLSPEKSYRNTVHLSVYCERTFEKDNTGDFAKATELEDVFVVQSKFANVGIGTTSPLAKLHVAGTIRATEIKVEAKTADFVFSDNYPLRNLEQVEDYIKEHKHLPDIPSADEMEASGVNLAEMNKLLLQKIEELTLYAIEKNKEITGLKEKQREEDEMKNMQEKEMKNLTRQISKMEEENIKVNERLKVIEALITESIGR